MSKKKNTIEKKKSTKSEVEKKSASKKKASNSKPAKSQSHVKNASKSKNNKFADIIKSNSVSAAIIFIVLLLAILLLVKYADFDAQKSEGIGTKSETIESFSAIEISYNTVNGSLEPVLEKKDKTINITVKEYEFIAKLFKASGMQSTEESILQESAVREVLYYNSKGLADEIEIEENINKLLASPNVQNVIASFNMSKEEFRNEYSSELKKDYLIQKFLSEKIAVNLPKAEARNTSDILVCYNGTQMCDSNRSKEEALELANMIQEMAENNNSKSNFGSLAQEYSDGPSAVREGYLGMVRKGQMVSEFEEVNFNVEKGEISEPVETNYGFHVIRVSEISEVPDTTSTTKVLYETRDKIIESIEFN